MNIRQGEAWALVTARGGSKSIPLKNIHPVAGRPLLDYCLTATARARTISRTLCSTDHDAIAAQALKSGAEVLRRPEHLGQDLTASVDVVVDAVRTLEQSAEGVADIIVLVQPTSIFLTAAQVDAVVGSLLERPEAMGAQTVVEVPHQFHAHNQRGMSSEGDDVWFLFPEERERGYSKQTKPKHYTYGNLIAARSQALLTGQGLFPRPNVPHVIPLDYAYDLDGFDDIPMAEIMLERNMVELDEPLAGEKP